MKDENAPDWLPDLVEFDWNRYEESLNRAYAVFTRDFGTQSERPNFRGKRMGLKRHPEFEGKSATFWHFVTEGPDEPDRVPDRERVERIAWPKAMLIEAAAASGRVVMWANERRRSGHAKSTRWVVALDTFGYVIVVDEREEYVLPWTAYVVDGDHRQEKLRKEYDAWKAQKS